MARAQARRCRSRLPEIENYLAARPPWRAPSGAAEVRSPRPAITGSSPSRATLEPALTALGHSTCQAGTGRPAPSTRCRRDRGIREIANQPAVCRSDDDALGLARACSRRRGSAFLRRPNCSRAELRRQNRRHHQPIGDPDPLEAGGLASNERRRRQTSSPRGPRAASSSCAWRIP